MNAERAAFALRMATILAVVIVVVAICGTVIVAIAVRRAPSNDTSMLTVFFERGALLQIMTAAAVVISALLLRVLDQISSEAAVSVLSGTAGYVLGGLPRPSSPKRDTPS